MLIQVGTFRAKSLSTFTTGVTHKAIAIITGLTAGTVCASTGLTIFITAF